MSGNILSCDALGDLSSSVPGDTLLEMSRVRPFYEPQMGGGAKHQIKRGSSETELPCWSIAVIVMPRQAPSAKSGSVARRQGHTPELRLLHGAVVFGGALWTRMCAGLHSNVGF